MPDNELVENIKLAFDLQKKGQYREAIAVLYKVLVIEPDNIEAITQIAYLFYARHDIDIATEYYERALALDAQNALALEGLLTIYKSTKEYKKALQTVNKLCEISPGINSFIQLLYILCLNEEYEEVIKTYDTSDYKEAGNDDIFFYVGLSYFKLKNYHDAELFLTKAVGVNPQNSESLFYLSKILYDKQEYSRADELLNDLFNVRQSAKAYNLKGLIQFHFNNLTKAIDFFSYATKINNKISEYYYNLAIAYSLSGWFNEAEMSYRKAILLEPENIHYHYTLAYLYYEMNQPAKAKEELDYIFTLNENHLDAKILKALIMLDDGEAPQAKEVLTKLVADNDKSDFLFFALGKAYKELRQYDDAIVNIQKAIDIKPSALDYKSELAECFILKEKYDIALVVADDLIKANKGYIHAYLLKSKVLLLQDSLDNALQYADVAIKLDTNSDTAYYLKSQILFKKRLPDAAVENIKIAITLAPDDIRYYRLIAQIYASTSNYQDALDYYKEIFDTVVDNAELYIKAGECAENIGDFKQARAFYLRAYRVEPTNPVTITEYSDFLVRSGQHRHAMKFMYDIIKNENALPSQSVLIPKYDEIKQAYLAQASIADKVLYKMFKI